MKDRINLYLFGCKPKVVILILITSIIGFVAAHSSTSYLRLVITCIGVGLSCAGASVLNQVIERDSDAKMVRTRGRPLPAGLIPPAEALAVGVLLVMFGTALLAVFINLVTAFLALLTSFIYVAIYTPLKRMTWLNTMIGAIPGALPVMGGWTAATGELSMGAWILFGIVYFWQHPHFYAIAWKYRQDYANAGLKMLPVVDVDGSRTFKHIIIFTVFLIGVSFLPAVAGLSGTVYFWGTAISGVTFLASTFALSQTRSIRDAERVIHASVIYLPVVLSLVILDLNL